MLVALMLYVVAIATTYSRHTAACYISSYEVAVYVYDVHCMHLYSTDAVPVQLQYR